MAKFCPLFSGSKGNSTYIDSDAGGILIDAGVSAKAIELALYERGIDKERINAIFITHEHIDHIRGLKTISKKWNVDIFASEETALSIEKLGVVDINFKISIIKNSVNILGMDILRFPTSHDCDGSSGYRITLADDTSISVCTDLGIISDSVRNSLFGCSLVMLESNHDIGMLQNGSYPYSLKHRILSEYGHLSNNACSIELPSLAFNGTTRFVLAHLSEENNHPEIARAAARATLIDNKLVENKDYLLHVLKPKDNQIIYI